MIRPSTRKLHESKANSSATFRPQEGRRKRVSNAILKKRTLFLTVLTTLLLITLFLLPNSLNPSDKGDRGVAQEKHNVMEAAFAEIREKVEKEKVDYSDDWRVSDMWKSLKCEEIFKSERPIHSQTDWLFSRSLYRGIVGSSQSSIGSSDGDVKNGFQYKVEAKQAPPKGRGIFALEDIEKGTLIWSTRKTARFRDGPSYRKFIFGLEAGFACDVLQWAYVQDVGDGDLRISVDLDEGCFCNNGGSDGNMGCDEEAAKEYEGGCKDNYFALKDIKAGDEIECRYGQFAVGGWHTFGV